MKATSYGLYAVALAIVLLGASWAGVTVGASAVFGFALACPLMMFVMMRGRAAVVCPVALTSTTARATSGTTSIAAVSVRR